MLQAMVCAGMSSRYRVIEAIGIMALAMEMTRPQSETFTLLIKKINQKP
jgi:hypothetical protein